MNSPFIESRSRTKPTDIEPSCEHSDTDRGVFPSSLRQISRLTCRHGSCSHALTQEGSCLPTAALPQNEHLFSATSGNNQYHKVQRSGAVPARKVRDEPCEPR